MKKSALNVLILALVVVNLILSAVVIFSVVPASRKTDKMITQICSALNLELKSDEQKKKEELTIDQMETYDIEDKLTIPLKKGADGKDHFAIVSVSIVVNKKDKDYKKFVGSLKTKESLIKDAINSEIGGFVIEELQADQEKIQKTVLTRLQKLFDSEFIVKVAFRDILFQ